MNIHKFIKRDIAICFCVFLVMGILISPLRSGMWSIGAISGMYLSSIVGFVLNYILVLYFLHKKDSFGIVVAATVGFFFFTLPFRILFFESTLISLLDSIIHFSAIIAAYGCHKLRGGILKWCFSALVLSGAYWISTSGNTAWIHYCKFRTFSGRINEKLNAPLYFQTTTDSTSNISFGEQLIVLDFWSQTCGYCYKGFPKLQKAYNSFPKEKAAIYAVYVKLSPEDNHAKGDSILRAKGYTFPMLSVSLKSPALLQLNITQYPTVVILNGKELLFKGSIDNAIIFLEKYLHDD